MKDAAARPLIIKRVSRQARNIRSFDMLPEEANGGHGISFVPGQVAVLRVTNGEQAYFAFSSAPEDAEMEFLVKQGYGAGGAIYEMKEGDRVELVEIVGHGFALSEHKGKDLVFVAMGTGVAPLRSALRHVLKHATEFGQLVVLYGARTPDDFCYTDEVDEWEGAGVELRRVISRPDGHDWSGPTGYVQSLLDHVLPDLSSPVALICGSREMIEQTRMRLSQMGFQPEAILTNY
jgi:sulfhydrogenase subunit gamma (sulfur reductase)